MSDIRGLYFKLNVDKPRDEFIYRFFTMQPDTEKIDKIALLDKMITVYINTAWQEYNKEDEEQ